jgi:hypothetical protein
MYVRRWNGRVDLTGPACRLFFLHGRAGRPAGYSVFFSFARQKAGPWSGSIVPGTVEPRA